MIHKKNDILFTLFMLAIILTTGMFLGSRVLLEVNDPPELIDGSYDAVVLSNDTLKDTRDGGLAPGDVDVSEPILLEAARLREDGYLDASLSMVERVYRKNPTDQKALDELVSVYIAMEQFEKAEQMLLHLLELAPEKARFYYNMGVVKSMQGESAEAVAAYRKAVELNPIYTRAHYNLGVIHLKMDSLEEAEGHFRAIIQNDQSADSAKAYFQLGYILSRQKGRTAGAIEFYTKAITLKPDYYQARNNLALQLEKIDEKEKAIVELKKAIALNPSLVSALLNLGRLYSESGQLEESADSYRLATQAKPSLAKAFFSLGAVEEERSRFEEAIEAYESVLALEPDHLSAIMRLGVLYGQANESEKTETYLKRALSIDPKYASAWDGLGTLYAGQNRNELALEHFNKAIELDPNEPQARIFYSHFLAQLHRTEESDEQIARAMDIDPFNPFTQMLRG
ncbi:MAG: tetratricopeptide repeat protein, partial [Anaerohalosphaeraceae bacterium]